MLLLVASLFATVAIAQLVEDPEETRASFVPRLALDLEGGVQLILAPRLDEDAQGEDDQITGEDVSQAIEIIRQRVDASGVAEAEITRQGANNIVVGLPGQPDENTLNLVRQSAELRLRAVLTYCTPLPIPDDSPYETLGGGNVSCEEIVAQYGPFADVTDPDELDDTPATTPTDASDLAWITQRLAYDVATLDCTLPENRVGGLRGSGDGPLVTCDEEGLVKYVLGPAELEGTQLNRATSGLDDVGRWAVNIEFDSTGRPIFSELSSRLFDLTGPRNQFASVLDGLVIIAPSMNYAIYDGRAAITGNFNAESAGTLANQLSFGSLPLNFEVLSQEQISATLGTEQLFNGIIAGAIGLVLVTLYLAWQYRAISIVAVGSLVVAAVGTYGAIIALGWLQGYRLSLAGVAGIIVAIGITADSFILYFERIRDEVREGRSLAGAIEHGWARAKRTIIIADLVTLMAAVVLYFLAVGNVRGFAFTLGLTTVIDLVVAFLFTQPLVQVLGKTRFFGNGHKLSGFDPVVLGAKNPVYIGRGRVRAPTRPQSTSRSPAEAEDTSAAAEKARAKSKAKKRAGNRTPAAASTAPRQTIAERRAAERKAAAAQQAGTTLLDEDQADEDPADEATGAPDPEAPDSEGGSR